MDEKLVEVLNKIEGIATKYENEYANNYAEEILEIQEKRKELESSINESRVQITEYLNRENTNYNNLENNFKAIFDTFYNDALKTEKEAKRKLTETEEERRNEILQLEAKIERISKLSNDYKLQIKKEKMDIASASVRANPDPKKMDAMRKHLSAVEEELKTCRKESRNYKKKIKGLEAETKTLQTNYEEAKRDRIEIGAQYEAYRRGYSFQYGEKKDGSKELELQLIPRRVRVMKECELLEIKIDDMKEEIEQLNERENFLSISAKTRKENIIKMLQEGVEFEKIEKEVELLASYINDEAKKSPDEIKQEIEQFKEEIANKDYTNKQEYQRDENIKKIYQKRLEETTNEIDKANSVIANYKTTSERELEEYQQSIKYYTEKKQELTKKFIMRNNNLESNGNVDVVMNRIIANHIKEISEKIDKLEEEYYNNIINLEEVSILEMNKVKENKAHLEQEQELLSKNLQSITNKLSDKNNYIDTIEKVTDSIKLAQMEDNLAKAIISKQETKEILLNEFKEAYQNSQKKTNNSTPEQQLSEADIDLMNRIISHNDNTDGYMMGTTEVGLPNEIVVNHEAIQPVLSQEPEETLTKSFEQLPIGLPGETIDGTKVGEIDPKIVAKIKEGNQNSDTIDEPQEPEEQMPEEEEEEIEEVFSIKDIPRKLKTAIRNLLKRYPILTAAATAIVIGIGILGFGNSKELAATGSVVTETTLDGKDDETARIGSIQTDTVPIEVHESSDYDFGGKNKTGKVEGESKRVAVSFIDKNTGQIIEVEREEGKSIEEAIKENNIDIDNSLVRVLLEDKGWVDVSVDQIKEEMSREKQNITENYDFNMTDAQIKDGKIILSDENSENKIEIDTTKLSKGTNQIDALGSDGKTYTGKVEVVEQNKLDENGNEVKGWSFANIGENAKKIFDGNKEPAKTRLIDDESKDQEDLVNDIVEGMANEDYIVDTSASTVNEHGRGRM